MLDQLWMYWVCYQLRRHGGWDGERLDLEIGMWLSQHCVEADDFAFSLALSMRDSLR